MTTTVSGMAASIRAATDNETFDLAGHDVANISSTIKDAFSDPFNLDEMIRITFIVGGGKLSRQKYDEKAMQTVTAALRELNFVEDRGASCVKECGGCYKTQHDTAKNVFTVVVFPRLVGLQDGVQAGSGGLGQSESLPSQKYPIPIPLVEGTAVHSVLLASDETFQKMAPSICPSWSEKKICAEVLNLALETVECMDAKLLSGTPLTDVELSFYDEVGGAASIGAKAEHLKKLMQKQVEEGVLTREELDRLLQQVDDKIVSLSDEIDAAMQKSQDKKAVKLTAQKEKAQARKCMLKGHTAHPPYALKNEIQIMKLRKQIQPLLKLEQSSKGRLLTMKETKELAAKDEILEEISQLEEASRGWFEDDDAFQIRLEVSRKKKVAVSNCSSNSGKTGGKGKAPWTGSRSIISGNNIAWHTPGGNAAKQAALGKMTAVAKSKPTNSGGVFAAMMMDSDSDSD
ncbi:hypothetical protein ACHAXH_003149 [Discostella pseudostelligera]